MGVSKNRSGPPKSSILIGFSIINHPFWGPLGYHYFWKHPNIMHVTNMLILRTCTFMLRFDPLTLPGESEEAGDGEGATSERTSSGLYRKPIGSMYEL